MLRFDGASGISLACDVCGLALTESDARVFYRTDKAGPARVVHEACVNLKELFTGGEVAAWATGQDVPAVPFQIDTIILMDLRFMPGDSGTVSPEKGGK